MRKISILVVDDEPWNQEIAELILSREGHRVLRANDGEEALAACRREHFDLILMDLQMPRMDGLAATRRLRAEANTVPVIFVTGSSDRADARRAIEAGGDHFFKKPYRREELLRVVERVMQKRGLAPEGIRRQPAR